MRLVPCNYRELKTGRTYKKGVAQQICQEFIDNELECERVDGHNYSSAKSCYYALKHAAKNMKYDHILVITRKGEVYLINKILIQK